MKKHISLTLGALACGIVMSHAASSAFTTFDENFTYTTVINASGALIPNGTGNASVGYFMTLTDVTIRTATPAQLAADFVVYSTATFGGAAVLNSDGSFSADSMGTPITPAFTGQTAFVVMGNGATLLASSQFAVVKDGVFPADPAPFTTAFDRDLVTLTANPANVIAGTLVPIVQNSLTGEGLTPGATSIRMIPEPSSLALLGLAGLLAVRRRR